MSDFERLVEQIRENTKLLEEAIKIIMHEWGYTHDQTVEWLKRKVEGKD